MFSFFLLQPQYVKKCSFLRSAATKFQPLRARLCTPRFCERALAADPLQLGRRPRGACARMPQAAFPLNHSHPLTLRLARPGSCHGLHGSAVRAQAVGGGAVSLAAQTTAAGSGTAPVRGAWLRALDATVCGAPYGETPWPGCYI